MGAFCSSIWCGGNRLAGESVIRCTFDDGVAMVLVPPGCFDEPFWIDKFEVADAQFIRLSDRVFLASSQTGANYPLNRTVWDDARNFCEQRRVRLPTAVESRKKLENAI